MFYSCVLLESASLESLHYVGIFLFELPIYIVLINGLQLQVNLQIINTKSKIPLQCLVLTLYIKFQFYRKVLSCTAEKVLTQAGMERYIPSNFSNACLVSVHTSLILIAIYYRYKSLSTELITSTETALHRTGLFS